MLDEIGNRRLLLIESHAGLRRDLVRALSHLGFIVEDFKNARQVMAEGCGAPSGVQVIDLGAPGAEEWLQTHGSIENTIVLVSDSSSRSGKKVLLPDGMEVLYKPFSIHTLETRVLARSVGASRSGSNAMDPILETREPELLALLARARRLARRNLPMVIEGELGTGRRALAVAIHGWSLRAGAPLLSIERAEFETLGTAALADALDEVISAATAGSIVVVDPVDFPESIQLALIAAMRRFEEKGPRWLTIARQPLERAVREGRLMLELQYRLDAAGLFMPTFRDRALDQVSLCQGIARRVAREMAEPPPLIDQAMVDLLARDGFPGNQLGVESRLRSCMVRSDGDARRIGELLSQDSEGRRDEHKPLASLHLKTLERDTIIRALAHWAGNRTRASEALGISVRTLRNKIREYGLR